MLRPKHLRRVCRRLRPVAALLLTALSACQADSDASDCELRVQVVYAQEEGHAVDARLRGLAEELSTLPFKSYHLRDEATFRLEPGGSGRLQLPNQAWLKLTERGASDDGKMHVDIAVPEMQFRASVGLKSGATVAVGGTPFAAGTLILTISRS